MEFEIVVGRVGLTVEVEFDIERGCPGDYWTPPTSDKVHILDLHVVAVNTSTDTIYRDGYEDWFAWADKIAWKHADVDAIAEKILEGNCCC